MKRQSNKSLRVGIMVFVSLILLILIIYFIGSKDNLFKSRTVISAPFSDIHGVVVGSNVLYSGITVGTVNGIKISSDSTVTVEMSIVKEYAQYIYQDAVAEISRDGIVGNKVLKISRGSAAAGPIQNGSVLEGSDGLDLENMITDVHGIVLMAKDAAQNIDQILKKIEDGDGDIAQLLNNNHLSSQLKSTMQRASSSLESLNRISQKIESGDGDIALLLNSTELSSKADDAIQNINEISEQGKQLLSELEKTIESVNSGSGALGLLLNDKKTAQNIDSTIIMLQRSLSEFDKTAKAIQESGLINAFSRRKQK